MPVFRAASIAAPVMTPGSLPGWPGGSFLGLLPAAECGVLLSSGSPVRFTRDDILVLQGDVGDFLYVLTGGLVKVLFSAESGAETALAMRSRGDLVGEFALMDDKPRIATARAIGPVTAVRVSRASWAALIGEHPVLQAMLTRYLLAKMRASTERHAAERVWEAGERLAQVLYDLAMAYGERQPGGAIRVPITQGELGQLAGAAVSTTERELARLRRKGVVLTSYSAITVRDIDLLRDLRFSDKNDSNPLSEGNVRRLGQLRFFPEIMFLAEGQPAAIGQGWWSVAVSFSATMRNEKGSSSSPGRRQSRFGGWFMTGQPGPVPGGHDLRSCAGCAVA